MDRAAALRCTGLVHTRTTKPRTAAVTTPRNKGRLSTTLLADAVWSRSDAGTRESQLTALQRLAGNQAVARLVAVSFADVPGVSLHGETTGAYDGGKSRVRGRRVTRATDCDCPDEDPCRRATGTLQVTYRVDVTIDMPGVPDGLSPCQQRRVRAFLRDVLGPHERDHRQRMRTYNGVTRRPFDVKACGMDALHELLESTLQQMHDDEAAQRQADAQASSDSIDPFDREIALDCE